MKKRDLKLRVKVLEDTLDTLQKKYVKLENDKLTVYNLLYRVNKELDEALANKETFIASMSHELRSPLTAVLGNSALLAETGLNKQQTRYLEQLNDSADFLMALLGDLLDVSKLKESKIELNVQETHLDKLLLHCANMVESKISKGVEFNVSIPSLDYYAFLDKKRVQQIFINILTNAAKFTKSGQIEFSLLEINQINEQLEVIVAVKDTGPGIPNKIKETLFEPFSSTDVEEGTGLGLYISHELVSLMGGEIVVDSTEGKGTSFKVKFYCEKSALKMRNLTDNSENLQVNKKKNYAHLKILIVEDIVVNREFLKEMFKVFFNVQVDSAENGQIAVEKTKKNFYDVIFMDMRMPVLDGVKATKQIRTFNKEVPIVCMSANVYREDKHEAHMAGMNDFIEKPLEPKDIEERLLQLDISKPEKSLKDKHNKLRAVAVKHFEEHFDEATSLSFITMAEEGLHTNIIAVEKHFLEKNTKLLRDDFHALAGILSNLGLKELAQKAGLLQAFAKDDDLENIKKRIELFLLKVKEFFN
ncbi:MAG: Sensory box sensor histidine kinase/response regulator [uncultured Sulfurovum sp.]|uniref:histidine kinase n=1 Tax=uncultured Sulfurovum sp. TaxID=269237 RepID=A0A6S6S213_9BACT|nr:MAG: Sensory box sensor histidine kinase/response regulator [uncultured Sulfurovum sp.]